MTLAEIISFFLLLPFTKKLMKMKTRILLIVMLGLKVNGKIEMV